MNDTTNAKSTVTIKKYANRRLYNTATSSYVTLEDLSAMVKEGVEFNVYDAKTSEDITRSVLTQIIVEEEGKSGQQNLLPIGFLRQLISFYGDNMQWMVPKYLDHSMQMLAQNQEQIKNYFQSTFGGMFPFGSTFEEMGKQNMAMFERTMNMFTKINPSMMPNVSGMPNMPNMSSMMSMMTSQPSCCGATTSACAATPSSTTTSSSSSSSTNTTSSNNATDSTPDMNNPMWNLANSFMNACVANMANATANIANTTSSSASSASSSTPSSNSSGSSKSTACNLKTESNTPTSSTTTTPSSSTPSSSTTTSSTRDSSSTCATTAQKSTATTSNTEAATNNVTNLSAAINTPMPNVKSATTPATNAADDMQQKIANLQRQLADLAKNRA